MKKVFYCLLVILLILGFEKNNTVFASEGSTQNGSCVVEVRFTYRDANNEIYWTEESYGMLVGNEGEGASYVVAVADKVSISEEEMAEVINAFPIAENELEQFNSVVEIVIGHDITVAASVQTNSMDMNLAILQLGQSIYNRDVAVFNMDEESYYIGQGVSLLLPNENDEILGVIQGETILNEITYIQHDITISENNLGGAIVNSGNEVIAFQQNIMMNGYYCALDVKEITSVLRTLGIPYTVADHTDYSVNKTALNTAVELIYSMDLNTYTEETALQMESLLLQADIVLKNEAATQEEVDAMCQQLIEMQALMIKDDSLSGITVTFIILASVFFLAFVIMIAFLQIKKKRKKAEQEEKELMERKKAPINQGPFVPRIETNKIIKPEREKTFVRVEPYEELTGFAPTSTKIRLNADDTTILSEEENKKEKTEATLIQCNLDKEIKIVVPQMVLGKSKEKADYCIENNAISRTHAKIQKKGDEFYLCDMQSTNGTFLDDRRLLAGEECKLTHGSKIKLANEEFIFVKE